MMMMMMITDEDDDNDDDLDIVILKVGSMIYTFCYRLFIFRDFIHLLSKVATMSKDTSPLYVRIGPLQGEIIIICLCIVILFYSVYRC
jgi:hypothetical protein